MESEGFDRPVWAHLALLIALPALVFSNTLDNAYHFDSVHRVERNAELEHVWPPWRFFVDVGTASTDPHTPEYRPLAPFSLAIGAALADALGIERLAGHHLGNIAIHIAIAILLYLLFSELLVHRVDPRSSPRRAKHLAFVAALLFAIHPVSGSSVNYLANRDLLLMMAFLTAALWVYARMRRRGDSPGAWLAVFALLICSLLSKPNAIAFVALVFAFELIVVGSALADRGLWLRTLAIGLPCAGLAWVTVVVGDSASDVRSFDAARSVDYALVQARVHLFHYLRNAVWPFELRALPLIARPQGWFDPHVLAGAAFIATTLVVAWRTRRSFPIAAFSILAYWILFALSSSLLPLRYDALDYRQYPSLAFFCLPAVMAGFAYLRGPLLAASVLAVAVYLGAASHYLNTTWRTEESYWERSVRLGGTTMAHVNYGAAVARRDPALAEYHYQEALRLHPENMYASINLGNLHLREGREREGLALLRTTIERNPNAARPQYWLGRALHVLGRDAEATVPLRRAVELDARNLQHRLLLASALVKTGQCAAALPHFEAVLRSRPRHAESRRQLARCRETLRARSAG